MPTVALRGRRVRPRWDPRDRRRLADDAFKTSTGAEIRFFMPVLNVPFRLIFAMNPSRGDVLDNNLQPEKGFKFRFAVGIDVLVGRRFDGRSTGVRIYTTKGIIR